MEFRGIRATHFGVSDQEIAVTLEKMESGKTSVIKHLVVNYDKKLINTIISTFGKNRSTFRLDRIA
jgi:hypothetical protein